MSLVAQTLEETPENSFEIIVDEGLISESDDELSITSFDGAGNEDVVSISDSEQLSDYVATETEGSRDLGGIPSFNGLDEANNESITRSNSLVDIKFEEPVSTSKSTVSRVVQHLKSNEAEAIFSQMRLELPNSPAKICLRQSMIPRTLEVDGPFRVIYVGPDNAKDLVISKIGGALAVTALQNSDAVPYKSKSSRFNIVPVSSFGSFTSPEVELVESFGVEMVVDHCIDVQLDKSVDKEYYLLTLNAFQELRGSFESGAASFEPSDWKKPHLGIIFLAGNETSAQKELRMKVRRFLTRCSIPTLIISETPFFRASSHESFSVDNRTLHFSVESETAEPHSSLIHRRMPVDIAHFLALDVMQMNRNLAFVTGLYTPTDRSNPEQLGELCVVNEKGFPGGVMTKSRLNWRSDAVRFRLAIVWWIFLCGVFSSIASAGLPSLLVTFGKIVTEPKGPVNISSVSNSSVQSPTSSTLSYVVPSSLATVGPTSTLFQSSLASSQPIQSFENQEMQNSSQKFELRIIGDHTILLRPSYQFTILRRPPQLHVKVSRNSKMIPSEFKRLFSGIYSLDLPIDEAWGPINVTITTKSRPIMDETFEVDFGRPWLKLSRWRALVVETANELATSYESYHRQAAHGVQEISRSITDGTFAAFGRAKIYAAKLKGAAAVLETSKSAAEKALRRAQFQAGSIWKDSFRAG